MSFDVFEQRYQPFEAHELGGDGSMGDHMVEWQVAKDRKPEQVWTVVSTDSGKLYLASGFHIVNRVGYIVCKEPHGFTERDVLYC